MYESHASLRDDYQVSCPELDAVVEIARSLGKKSGVIGCRMTGGGFGGCAVSLVRTDALSLVTRRMEEAYERKTKNHAGIFSVPSGGGRPGFEMRSGGRFPRIARARSGAVKEERAAEELSLQFLRGLARISGTEEWGNPACPQSPAEAPPRFRG